MNTYIKSIFKYFIIIGLATTSYSLDHVQIGDRNFVNHEYEVFYGGNKVLTLSNGEIVRGLKDYRRLTETDPYGSLNNNMPSDGGVILTKYTAENKRSPIPKQFQRNMDAFNYIQGADYFGVNGNFNMGYPMNMGGYYPSQTASSNFASIQDVGVIDFKGNINMGNQKIGSGSYQIPSRNYASIRNVGLITGTGNINMSSGSQQISIKNPSPVSRTKSNNSRSTNIFGKPDMSNGFAPQQQNKKLPSKTINIEPKPTPIKTPLKPQGINLSSPSIKKPKETEVAAGIGYTIVQQGPCTYYKLFSDGRKIYCKYDRPECENADMNMDD